MGGANFTQPRRKPPVIFRLLQKLSHIIFSRADNRPAANNLAIVRRFPLQVGMLNFCTLLTI